MTEPPSQAAERLVAEAVLAFARGDDAAFEAAADQVAAGPGVADWTGVAEAALAVLLRRHTAAAWRRGWQPADVAHHVRRRLGERHAGVAVDAIAAELHESPLAERWRGQLDALDARWPGDAQWLELWRAREGLVWPVAVTCLLEVVALLALLPELPELGPPSQLGPGGHELDRARRRTLERVRALLAKAESTEFDHEAATLTARAQELMARHSIDAALLAATEPGARHRPSGIRVAVDNPYEAVKATLLEAIASANSCRTVWHSDLGFSTVLGFGADLEAVEMLYTSLLSQATTVMVRAGSGPPGRGRKARARTKEFRHSFLAAYVQRVAERLETAARTAKDQAAEEGERDLLPVLAARDTAVQDAVDAMFPDLVRTRVRAVTDYQGWTAGLAEADRAALHARGQVQGGPGER